MHYCIQKIYHVYYTTQWNFKILRKFSHMTLASPNEKRMRVADIVRRFCQILLWRREFCFDVGGNFGLKKITPNCNALAKSIISYIWVSYFTFVFSWQCKTMLFTKSNNMQWRHRSVRISLRGINKKGVEIGERQNRCHDDRLYSYALLLSFNSSQAFWLSTHFYDRPPHQYH